VILYASLFTSPEARFLLATPARADRIFATKFQAAIAFSSWAFLILGVPILVSYGLVAGVPWYFYPLLPAALLGFVLLPGSASSLACLLFVRYFPRNRKQAILAGGLVLAAAGSFWLYKVGRAAKGALQGSHQKTEVDNLIAQFAVAQSPFTPSHWMTQVVMSAALDEPTDALIPLAKLWSNGLLAYLVAAWVSARVYRTGYDRIAGAGRGKRVYRGNVLDAAMESLVFYLDRPTRILIVKDFRTFRRDPTQWVLLVVFAGLMILGGMNFRQYYTADLIGIERYIVSLVNVAGTSVLLCAGLSRFIFPLISLEGRKFWVLGLMPVSRWQILFGKFAFAATGSVVIAEVLILGSDLILGVPAWAVVAHALTGVVVAVGLSGLNVGLGAYMPNFRETDPSKIVVGFGGTVNMVLGLLYLVLVVGLMSGPLYASELIRKYHGQQLGETPPWWVFAGMAVGTAIGAVAVFAPLKAGAKALEVTEF
jgi:ABC-2 type transport system permease protein